MQTELSKLLISYGTSSVSARQLWKWERVQHDQSRSYVTNHVNTASNRLPFCPPLYPSPLSPHLSLSLSPSFTVSLHPSTLAFS